MNCLWVAEQTVALLDEGLFATFTRAGAWQHGSSEGWTTHQNLGFVCPVCCKVWGVLSSGQGELVFTTSCCSRHAGQGEYSFSRVDGSLLYSYSTFEYGNFDLPLLAALPPELLRREFDLHLNHFERS